MGTGNGVDAAHSQAKQKGFIDWRAVATKVAGWAAVAILGALVGGFAYLKSNVVFAEDLAGLADMLAAAVAADVEKKIAPVAAAANQAVAMAQQNATDIRQGRIDDTRAAIRDLRKEVQEMEARRAAGDNWTQSDERLLEEWREDLVELEGKLESLESTPAGQPAR